MRLYYINAIRSIYKKLKQIIMAKSKDARKTVKKEALKTPKEKKAEKREKKAKRDY